MTTPSKTNGVNGEPQNRPKSGRFLPGQSGNPGGRPKTAQFAQSCRSFLNQKLPGKSGKTRLDALLLRLEKRDPRTLLAYAYGKPTETHLLGDPNGLPLMQPLGPAPTVTFIIPDNGRDRHLRNGQGNGSPH